MSWTAENVNRAELAIARRMLDLTYAVRDRFNDWGLAGERLFAEFLVERGALEPNCYWLINRLSLVEGSDIDHLVVGPTGIYVYESKYWRGVVTCREGVWQHQRSQDAEPICPTYPPDLQARRNMEDVAAYLHHRLPGLFRRRQVAIRGRVIFTYPGVRCDLRDTRVPCATLDGLRAQPDSAWAAWILPWGAPIEPAFDEEAQLEVVRTLLEGQVGNPWPAYFLEQELTAMERELAISRRDDRTVSGNSGAAPLLRAARGSA